jgi:enoyl-[acyl-carrier-protein] reductase (NADH)
MTAWVHSAARELAAALAAQPSRQHQLQMLDQIHATVAKLVRTHQDAAPVREDVTAVPVAGTPFFLLYRQSRHGVTILRLIPFNERAA